LRSKTLAEAEFISAEHLNACGPHEIEDFVGMAIEAMKLVIPEEKGQDQW